METMKLSSDEISKLQKLGFGACSTVYKYDNNLAIKVYNEKGLELHDNESFSALVGVKNETCVFPLSFLDVDGNFQGHVMQYVEGTELGNVIKDLDFRKLIEAIQKAEEDIEALASERILFEDLNQGGIMWNNEGRIKIIDTDFFPKVEDITEEQAYNYNLRSFNILIETELGILNGQSNIVSDFLQSNEEYNQFYMDYLISSFTGNNVSIINLLNKAIETFEHEFGVRPSSISEMEAILKDNNLCIQEEVVETEIPIFEPPSTDENPTFSEMDIGINTIDVPVKQKDEAQRQVVRDEEELVEGIMIE